MLAVSPGWVDLVSVRFSSRPPRWPVSRSGRSLPGGSRFRCCSRCDRAGRPLSIEEWALAYTRAASRSLRLRATGSACSLLWISLRSANEEVVMTPGRGRLFAKADSRTPHAVRTSRDDRTARRLCCFTLHAAVSLVWLRLPGRMSPVARHAVSACRHPRARDRARGSGSWGHSRIGRRRRSAALARSAGCSRSAPSTSRFRFASSLNSRVRRAKRCRSRRSRKNTFARSSRPASRLLVKMGCVEEWRRQFAVTEKGMCTARIDVDPAGVGVDG